MSWHLSWCYILESLVHYQGEYLESVFWSLVLGKNILWLCFVPTVLIYRMHQSICGESFRFFCIILLYLDVLCCNLEIELSVLWFQLSALSAPLPGSLGPSALWVLWIWHNIRIFLLFSDVFSDYIHPIIQLVVFLIASDCFFHKPLCVQGYGEFCGCLGFSCWKVCSAARTYPGIESWTVPFS